MIGSIDESTLIVIAQAADAPAATVVYDGRRLGPDVPREDCLRWMLPYRARVMSQRPELGAKNMVVLGERAGRLELQFFQGLGTEIDHTVQVCVNSAASAVAAARTHMSMLARTGSVTVVMGGHVFGLDLG